MNATVTTFQLWCATSTLYYELKVSCYCKTHVFISRALIQLIKRITIHSIAAGMHFTQNEHAIMLVVCALETELIL